MFKKKPLKVSSLFKSPKNKPSESPQPDEKNSKFSSSLGFNNNAIKNVSTTIKETTTSSESRTFAPNISHIHGLSGKIVSIAYDNSQSLIAVSTSSHELHIFGQKQVEVVLRLDLKGPVVFMKFVKGIYLVVVDAKNTIFVLSMYSKKVLATVFAPSVVTCVESDPSVDWILFGLQSGSTIIYDVDRNIYSDLKIENLQKSEFFTKDRLSPVVSITWNPRDLGSVLISYELVTVVYSFVESAVKQHFIYELEPYAPGGDTSVDISRVRFPKVIQSLYHPNSLHVLTVHEDGSLVFWDVNSGRLIQARTLFETNVHSVQPDSPMVQSSHERVNIKKVSWICENNPEYTSLVIASSQNGSNNSPALQTITILDLGGTPLYSMTSYDGMSNYYSKPKQERLCPLLNTSRIVDMIPMALSSPYFAGGHNPVCMLLLTEDGQLTTISCSDGIIFSNASLLPQQLSWTRPRVTYTSAISVPSKLWVGMLSTSKSVGLLRGGIPKKNPIKIQHIRTALVSGHEDGSIRMWDGSLDELDETSILEINISRILNRTENIAIENISFAPDTLELVAASSFGDVILFKYEVNQFYDPKGTNVDRSLDLNFSRFSLEDYKEPIIDVRNRSPPDVKTGLMPVSVINMNKGKVTALKNSNIGFVGIGYMDGDICLIDRRGPAIIYKDNVVNITGNKSSHLTCIDFAIMRYGKENYSSILMFCGTDSGEMITNKILPDTGGRFRLERIEVIRAVDNGPITNITTVHTETGGSCDATVAKMQDLMKGTCIPGKVIITGSREIKSYNIGISRDSSKSFKYPIASSGLSYGTYINSKGERKVKSYITTFMINGDIKVLTSDDLKETKSLHSPMPVHSKYVTQSAVMKNGDIFVRMENYLSVIISTLVDQQVNPRLNADTLFNPTRNIPYRPQVNSLQWARGTVYCTAVQLDELLGGPRRPASKYKESEIANHTLTLEKIENKDSMDPSLHYKKPVRSTQRNSSGYGMVRGITRAVETQWDSLETQINDYATAAGEGMNDMMEETGKDIVKGSFGF